jgi:2-amino-4-hydroxy-6-hydroxymethyldihydropteridine diphosphokinase
VAAHREQSQRGLPGSRLPPRPWVQACVGLGANLGDAPARIREALGWLAGLADTQLMQASGLYRTAPWEADGPDYINAVALLSTRLCAPDLLLALQALEQRAGRERPYPNAPRTLDLDLLLYGSATVQSTHLTVPHPRLWERAFVLVPLAEVAPTLVPAEALRAVADQPVHRLPAPLDSGAAP